MDEGTWMTLKGNVNRRLGGGCTDEGLTVVNEDLAFALSDDACLLQIGNNLLFHATLNLDTNGGKKAEIWLPLKHLACSNIYQALIEKALLMGVNRELEFRCGDFITHFSFLESGWRKTAFAVTTEEKLAVLVKHYLLVTHDANPLTNLLRSPQKGYATQLKNMLEGALSEE